MRGTPELRPRGWWIAPAPRPANIEYGVRTGTIGPVPGWIAAKGWEGRTFEPFGESRAAEGLAPALIGWSLLFVPAALIHPDAEGARVHAPRADPGPGPRPPNILILIGDDHAGGTLGIDGDPRRATPRLDALARQGVRFDRAYCNSPVCTPSRQSFITGRLAARRRCRPGS